MSNLDKLKELSSRLVSIQSNLASFFQFCPELLCIASKQGYFVKLNPAWEGCLGYKMEELLAVPYMTFIHPDDLSATRYAEEKLNIGESVYNFENRYRHRNGSYRYLSWTCTNYIEDGYSYSVVRDVTKEHEIEIKLAETQGELQDFFENAPIALHWADEKGLILWANKAELEMMGVNKAEYVGHNVCEFYVDQALCNDIFKRLAADEIIKNLRTKLIKKNGEILDVVISANVLKRDGKFIHTRNFTRDITIDLHQ